MLWLVTTAALAAEWNPALYGRPIGNVRVISVNGQTSAQALAGAEGGVTYRNAPWLGRTRAAVTVSWGFLSKSIGYDARLGSFIGPHSDNVTWQVGPDVWFNAYGSSLATDYYLAPSAGVDLYNVLTARLDAGPGAWVALIPGWAFSRARQLGRLGPFHELTAQGGLTVDVDTFRFRLGYQRVWNAAGATDGLILSGSI